MVVFNSQEEYDKYPGTRHHAAHRVVLVDPDRVGTSELPASGLKGYLAKGFNWPTGPAYTVFEQVAEATQPSAGVTRRRKARRPVA